MFNPLNYPLLLEEPKRLSHSEWQEHLPFAMFLIELTRPNVLVELGTHYGDSYCAFCQAVNALKLPTCCWAVDTWQGDPQAGLYGEEVLADLRTHHDTCGYNRFSTLLQSTFDKALGSFDESSVDLLHIDGFHTYDAVKHDYETWLPKMSEQGIILFHDVCEEQPGFGVRQLWLEVSAGRPNYVFPHGHGLGILAVGEKPPVTLLNFLAWAKLDPETTNALFYRLGRPLSERYRIQEPAEAKIKSMEQQIMAMCRTWNWKAAHRLKRIFRTV
jgi:hypothetical protein